MFTDRPMSEEIEAAIKAKSPEKTLLRDACGRGSLASRSSPHALPVTRFLVYATLGLTVLGCCPCGARHASRATRRTDRRHLGGSLLWTGGVEAFLTIAALDRSGSARRSGASTAIPSPSTASNVLPPSTRGASLVLVMAYLLFLESSRLSGLLVVAQERPHDAGAVVTGRIDNYGPRSVPACDDGLGLLPCSLPTTSTSSASIPSATKAVMVPLDRGRALPPRIASTCSRDGAPRCATPWRR